MILIQIRSRPRQYNECFVEKNDILPGTLVPNATNEMAVTASLRPTVQPKLDARSPMNAVRTPIKIMDTQKHHQPPP